MIISKYWKAQLIEPLQSPPNIVNPTLVLKIAHLLRLLSRGAERLESEDTKRRIPQFFGGKQFCVCVCVFFPVGHLEALAAATQ